MLLASQSNMLVIGSHGKKGDLGEEKENQIKINAEKKKESQVGNDQTLTYF